jgi:hypothetical protein
MNVNTANKTAVQPTAPLTRPAAQNQPQSNGDTRNVSVAPSKAQEPKPVVNTQGQMTGRLLNVSA